MRWDSSVMRDAANSLEAISGDKGKLLAKAAEIEAIELPGPKSWGAEALSTRSQVVSAVESVISEISTQLETLAKNLDDTAAAYDAGEAENIDEIDDIWEDLGPNSHSSIAPDAAPDGASISLDIEVYPSDSMGPYEAADVPNLAARQMIDIAALITGLPGNILDIMVAAEGVGDLFQALTTPDGTWAEPIMDEFAPVSKVGAGYKEFNKAMREFSHHIDFCADVLNSSWTSLSADRAFHYMGTVSQWLLNVGDRFTSLGSDYQDLANAIYTKAAEVAGEISSMGSVLKGWMAQISSLIASKLQPEEILYKTMEYVSKTVSLGFQIANLVITILQFCLSWANQIVLDSEIEAQFPEIARSA